METTSNVFCSGLRCLLYPIEVEGEELKQRHVRTRHLTDDTAAFGFQLSYGVHPMERRRFIKTGGRQLLLVRSQVHGGRI